MAAAALLRSVARKMARAPPPHPCPLLTRQFHGSARSTLGASLPPPPTRNEIQYGGGNRLKVAMAASGLPSLASKMSRAPPPDHRLLHARGLSSSTPPNRPFLPAEKFYYFSQAAIVGLLVFWLKPKAEELKDEREAIIKERDTLKKSLEECQREHTRVFEAQSVRASGRDMETDGQLSS